MYGQRGRFTQAPMNNLKNQKPPKVRQEKPRSTQPQENRYDVLGVIIMVVLPVMFLLALIISSNVLRYCFLALTVILIGTRLC